VAVIEVRNKNFAGHKILRGVKSMDNETFRESYESYAAKYHL
jgi:hypothetical protein